MSERLTAAKVASREEGRTSGLMAEKGRIASSISEAGGKKASEPGTKPVGPVGGTIGRGEQANQDAGELSAVCDHLQRGDRWGGGLRASSQTTFRGESSSRG